jgi:hypothetical protein
LVAAVDWTGSVNAEPGFARPIQFYYTILERNHRTKIAIEKLFQNRALIRGIRLFGSYSRLKNSMNQGSLRLAAEMDRTGTWKR